MEIDVNKAIKRFFIELENLFINNYHIVEISFDIIEGHVFLIEKINNGVVSNKINLNIEPNKLNYLYLEIYKKIKDLYLDSNSKYLGIQENISLENLDNPFLTISIRDIHQKQVNVILKNRYNEREQLESIKCNWIEVIKSKSKSK